MTPDLFFSGAELEEFQRGIDRLFPTNSFQAEEILEAILSGDPKGAIHILFDGLMSEISAPITGARNLFLWLLILGLLSALLSHFAGALEVHQTADLSFLVCFLLFTTVLLKNFTQMSTVTQEALEEIVLFMNLLIPTFLVTVGLALGSTGAALTGQIMVLVVYGVEKLLQGVLLPGISCYMMLSLVNSLWIEEKMDLLIDLTAKGIRWILKGCIGVITGVSVFQSFLSPVLMIPGKAAVKKIVGMIPGAGDLAEGAVELVMGSAMVMKNSVGIVMMLLLLVLCVKPLVKIAVTAIALKAAAAFMGLVSDKRLCLCIDRAGDAGLLLLKTLGTGMVLFFIAMAVVTAQAAVF